MNWICDIVNIRDGYDKAIINVETKDIVAVVSNLDSKFVSYIIKQHNEAISLAMKKGADIAKEVYRGNS